MLAVIMLAVLVAAVGAGWWLSVSRRSDPQAGRDVLASIRGRRLRAIWGDEPVTIWYLERRSDGVPIGWSMVRRIRLEDGRYAGTRVRRIGSMKSVESWILDDAARTGQYAATESELIQLPGQPMPIERRGPKTEIRLREGQVTVQRSTGRQTRTVSGPAPENYIPEGLTSLVMFEAVVRGQKTTFSILENSRAIVRGKLAFSTVTAAPEGRRVLRARFDNVDEIMAFDETGQLLRATYPGSGRRSEKCSAALVAKWFKEARLFARPAPTTAPVRDGEPGETAQPTEAPQEGSGRGLIRRVSSPSKPEGPDSPLPGSRLPVPNPRFRAPCSRSPLPGSRFPVPNPRFPIPGSQSPVPNPRFPIPGSWFPAPGSLFPLPGSWFLVPNPRSPVPGSRLPVPSYWPVRSRISSACLMSCSSETSGRFSSL